MLGEKGTEGIAMFFWGVHDSMVHLIHVFVMSLDKYDWIG